jgi:hypothetical protein
VGRVLNGDGKMEGSFLCRGYSFNFARLVGFVMYWMRSWRCIRVFMMIIQTFGY